MHFYPPVPSPTLPLHTNPHTIDISAVTNADVVCSEAVDVAEEVEVAPSHNQAHNGIDELLRASAYAPDFNEDSPARMEDLE